MRRKKRALLKVDFGPDHLKRYFDTRILGGDIVVVYLLHVVDSLDDW